MQRGYTEEKANDRGCSIKPAITVGNYNFSLWGNPKKQHNSYLSHPPTRQGSWGIYTPSPEPLTEGYFPGIFLVGDRQAAGFSVIEGPGWWGMKPGK